MVKSALFGPAHFNPQDKKVDGDMETN